MKINMFKRICAVILAMSFITLPSMVFSAYGARTTLFELEFNKNHSSDSVATSYTLADMRKSTGVNIQDLTDGDTLYIEQTSNGSWKQPKQYLKNVPEDRHIVGFNVPLEQSIKTGSVEVGYSMSGMNGLIQRRIPIMMSGKPILRHTINGWVIQTGDNTYDSTSLNYFHDKVVVIERESENEDWNVNVYYKSTKENPNTVTTISKEYLPEITSIGAGSDLIPENNETSTYLRFDTFKAYYTPVLNDNGRSEVREYEVPSESLPINVTYLSKIPVSNVELPFVAGSIEVTYENVVAQRGMYLFLYVDGVNIAQVTLSGASGTDEIVVEKATGIKPGSAIAIGSNHLKRCTVTGLKFKKENSPGADYFEVDLKNSDMHENGVLSVGTEYKTLETYFPFETTAVDICYNSDSSDTLSVKVNNGEEKTFALNSGKGTVRLYNDSVYPVSNAVVDFKKASATSNVRITDVIFYKKNQIWPRNIGLDIAYTDYEAALQTANIFKKDCNIFKSKNALRYMSYDNTSSISFVKDGVWYAPIDALMLAFGLYREERETEYFYRSSDNSTELTILKSSCIKNSVGDDCYSIKQVAEHFNYSSFESGDYLIVDKYKVRAKEIAEDTEILSKLQEEFNSFVAEKVQGNTYYVDASCKNSGNGSEALPFKTIQEAADIAKAGDRVLISDGLYRETVTPKNSGDATNPIIFEAKDGDNVTVSAFDEIRGFKLYYDGVYVAKLPVELDFGSDFVMYNGDVLVEGRQPNSHTSGKIYPENVTSPLWPTKGSITTPIMSFVGQSDTEIQNGIDNGLRGATYITFKNAGWNLAFGKIKESNSISFSAMDLGSLKVNKSISVCRIISISVICKLWLYCL